MKTLADYAAAVKRPNYGGDSFTRVSVRVDDDVVKLLDVMADHFNKSRSSFGGDVFEVAIIELGARLGFELVPSEDGGVEVGFFHTSDRDLDDPVTE